MFNISYFCIEYCESAAKYTKRNIKRNICECFCAANEFKNFVKNEMKDRNFVLDNAKFKRSEVLDWKDRTFPARGKILFFDMETLPSIADTMRITIVLISLHDDYLNYTRSRVTSW